MSKRKLRFSQDEIDSTLEWLRDSARLAQSASAQDNFVNAAVTISRLLAGDGVPEDSDPQATILWLTDRAKNNAIMGQSTNVFNYLNAANIIRNLLETQKRRRWWSRR